MLKIAYQGVSGAYSHIACMNTYPDAEYIACHSFEMAMEMVQTSQADIAVIPVENSNAGRVSDVHFLLPQTGLYIIGEYFLRIEHQLLGLKGTKLDEITLATSHPQALAQSSNFLKNNNILIVENTDTAKSCLDIINENNPKKAAIASKLAAEIYDLDILASNIENAHNNTTRFLIMANKPNVKIENGQVCITSLILKTKNIPAALYKALGCFANNGINITKLESYLLNGNFVSAQFYIEIEAIDNINVQLAFKELESFSENIHILGSYPKHEYRNLSN